MNIHLSNSAENNLAEFIHSKPKLLFIMVNIVNVRLATVNS